MKYQIKFVKGELAGQTFPIERDSVSIGRSRSNDIVLKTTDISRKHVIISNKGHGLYMDNLSSRPTTRCGSAELKMGDCVHLQAGTEVAIGQENAFVLESLEEEFTGGGATRCPGGGTVFSSDGNTMISAGGGQSAGFSHEGSTVPEQEGIAPAPVIDDSKTGTGSAKTGTGTAPTAGTGTGTAPTKNDAPAAGGKTQSRVSFFGETASSQKTVGLKTRVATPEEIQMVKDAEKKKLRLKSFMIGAGATLVLVLLGIYFYFTLYKAPEPYISWPKKDGKLLVGYAKIQDKDFPFINDMQLGFPNPPSTKIYRKPGLLEIAARTGKYMNVPCIIRLEYRKVPGGLKTDRLDAFERWMNEKSSGKNGWNFDVPSPLQFFFQDNGIPHYSISYTRTAGRTPVCGVARFFRVEDWQFALTVEIPAHERWRGTTFLAQNFIQFSYDLLYAHWEGMKLAQAVHKENSIYEAKMLLSRQSPSVWGRVEYLLKTALICCDRNKDAELHAEARRLLTQLRSTQIKWFNEQKIAYRRAQTLEDKDGMERITEKCKAVFSSPEDMRFHTVRQDNWR